MTKTKTHPKHRDSNSGRESDRVGNLNAIQLWGTTNGVLLPREAAESPAQVLGGLGVIKADLVDGWPRTRGCPTNPDVRDLEPDAFVDT